MPLPWSSYYSPEFTEAFIVEVNVDPKKAQSWGGGIICLRVPYNCYGEPIPVKGSERNSTHIATLVPGYEWLYPDYICRQQNYETRFPGIIQDIRSLRNLLEGCCPEELLGEQLGGEESQD